MKLASWGSSNSDVKLAKKKKILLFFFKPRDTFPPRKIKGFYRLKILIYVIEVTKK